MGTGGGLVSDYKVFYGPVSTLTGTLNGLISSAFRGQRLPSISNATDLYEDYEFSATIIAGAGDTDPSGTVQVRLYCSGDAGTTWETGSNTDALISLTGHERIVATIPQASFGAPCVFRLSDVSRGHFFCPQHFGLIVQQTTGQNLGAGSAIKIRGLRRQLV
jgi:hypothetical protein